MREPHCQGVGRDAAKQNLAVSPFEQTPEQGCAGNGKGPTKQQQRPAQMSQPLLYLIQVPRQRQLTPPGIPLIASASGPYQARADAPRIAASGPYQARADAPRIAASEPYQARADAPWIAASGPYQARADALWIAASGPYQARADAPRIAASEPYQARADAPRIAASDSLREE